MLKFMDRGSGRASLFLLAAYLLVGPTQVACLADSEASFSGDTSASLSSDTQSGGVTPLYSGGPLKDGWPTKPDKPDTRLWNQDTKLQPPAQVQTKPQIEVQNYNPNQKASDKKTGKIEPHNDYREQKEMYRNWEKKIKESMPPIPDAH